MSLTQQIDKAEINQDTLVFPSRAQRIPKVEVDETLRKEFALRVEDFVSYWRGQDSISERLVRREIAREEIAYLNDRLYPNSGGLSRSQKELEAIGAIYRPVLGESPLKGCPVRQPQEYLEISHMQSRFYRTLLTHPALLTAYQTIEANGLKSVTGNRLNSNHKLFDKSTAYTFSDFGFEPTPPELNDKVEERTSHSIAHGGIYSWTNHDFPSLYLMGSSMPDNWGDVALATAAQIGTVTFCPLDGDVHDPELQRLRYQSAKAIIESGILVQNHPYKDSILPSGETVAEYLPKFGLKHLGLSLKPSTRIVETYGDIIRQEGVQCVEIYDPGCTNLLERSVRDLRQAFPNLTIYAGRVLGNIDSMPLIIRLNKERVTFRLGIAEGQICSTSETGGGLAPKNCQGAAFIANHASDIGVGSGKPVIVSVEAGATSRLGELVALGVAGYSTTSLVSGTLEHLPIHHAWYQNGKFYKPYSGEASPVTKIKGGLIDRMGNPINPEGVNGMVPVNTYYTTLPYRTFALLVGLAKGLRFMREDNIISVLSSGRNFSNMITLFSDKASSAAAVHHGSGNGK